MEVHVVTDGELGRDGGAIHAAAFLDLKFGRSLLVNSIPAASNVLQIVICVFASGRAVKPFSIFKKLRADSPHSLDNRARVHPNKPRAARTCAPKVARLAFTLR